MTRIIFTTLFSLMLSLSFAQNSCSANAKKSFNENFTINSANSFHSSIYVKGDFTKKLIYHFLKDKKMITGYIHKTKKVSIPKIEAPVSFKIHEGVLGFSDKGSTYFHTFNNKSTELYYNSILNDNLKLGAIFYVNIDGEKSVSKEQLMLIIEYFKSIVK